MNRRESLQTMGWAGVGLWFSALQGCKKASDEPFTILLISGWQTVNIGDVAHTPGMIEWLHTYLPGCRIILWPRDVGEAEKDLLMQNFHNLTVEYGKIEEDIIPPNIRAAIGRADVCWHGSGPGLVGWSQLQAWTNLTDKPFGVFGVTLGNIDEPMQKLLHQADFVFTRETKSLENLKIKTSGIPVTDFAPDATFHMTLKDEAFASHFLDEHQLQDKDFICIVPRLRYTPYYKIHDYIDWSDEKIEEVDRINAEHAETDHAKLREVIVRWVEETGNEVIVCPEMEYQLEIMDPLLIDPLPPPIWQHVTPMRNYWLPHQAAALYARASAVISMECHSPILAAVNRTPSFYVRQPEDTIKGQMWYDIGLSDWVFEIEETTGGEIADLVMDVIQNPQTSAAYLDGALGQVHKKYSQAFSALQSLNYFPS